jgi:hypothetical protein
METVDCDLCGSDRYKVLIRQTDLLHKTTSEYFTYALCANISETLPNL